MPIGNNPVENCARHFYIFDFIHYFLRPEGATPEPRVPRRILKRQGLDDSRHLPATLRR